MPFRILETHSRSVSGTRDNDNKITVGRERSFTLDASDASANELDARAALAIEQGVSEGASYPGSQFFVCKSVRVTQVGPISYEATASYETLPYDEEENPGGDPDLDRPTIKYSSISSEVETDVDANGNPIATATGELYQGITRLVTDAAITITKKYSTFSPAAFYAYENKVNAGTFMGFPAGTVLVKKISPEEVRERERVYWNVSIELHVRQPLASDTPAAKAWWSRLRNEGFYCFEDLGSPPVKTKVRATDKNGEHVVSPVPLDENGYRLSSDDDPPTFLYFEHYPTLDFSQMNLGVT
jgi:hypothetical protein